MPHFLTVVFQCGTERPFGLFPVLFFLGGFEGKENCFFLFGDYFSVCSLCVLPDCTGAGNTGNLGAGLFPDYALFPLLAVK